MPHMVGTGRTEDEINFEIDRLLAGDTLEVEIDRRTKPGNFVAKNPCRRSGALIHFDNSDISRGDIGETVRIEVLQDERKSNGYVPAKIVEWPNSSEVESEEGTFENDRKDGIEWDGTAQNTHEGTAEHSQVFTEDDPRGDRNDLLNGNQ